MVKIRCAPTIQELRRLTDRVRQVIILSHSKQFLCDIWAHTDRVDRAALEVVRAAAGSSLQTWDVDQDSITEYDRRHELLRNHIDQGGQDLRQVAVAIRPVLEAYLRVACPQHFPPGSLLGPFAWLCEQRFNTPGQILDQQATQELRDITDYANRFHHDTNPGVIAAVNDVELTGFVRRTLAFVSW